MTAGFQDIPGIKAKINAAMLQKLKEKSSSYEQKATQNVKDSIKFFNAYDTGETHDSSDAKVNVDNQGATIGFRTPYKPGFYVIYGLGGNRKYGPRNYLAYAAGMFLKSIGIGSGKLLTAGNPRRTPTIKEGGKSGMKNFSKTIKKIRKFSGDNR